MTTPDQRSRPSLSSKQCREIVHIPEQLRRTGRGPSGFERHYIRRQCARPIKNHRHCWQHANRCFGVHTDGYYRYPDSPS